MSQRSSAPRAATPARRANRRDPSGPWVIDTRDVGRRPGSMKRYSRTVPAPDDLGFKGVIEVLPGSDVELDLRAESVVEGVLISGTVTAELAGECSRCLDPMSDTLTVQITELYAYPDSATDASTDADEVSRIVGINGDLVDTEPAVRDAVLLALPQAPLCADDCPGLCPECGGKRAELGADHRHETIDPRWAALAKRFGDTEEENE
jgi:uncharacterized protein